MCAAVSWREVEEHIAQAVLGARSCRGCHFSRTRSRWSEAVQRDAALKLQSLEAGSGRTDLLHTS